VAPLATLLALLAVAALPAQETRAFRISKQDEVTTFADGLEPTRRVYVAPSGDDRDGDGTGQRPFRTIARGIRAATPGTSVLVSSGTYAAGSFLEGIRGRAGAPIWIGGARGGPPPVIEGRGEGLHLSKASWVVLHDLEVRKVSGNGVNADDGGKREDPDAARFLVFQRLKIHEIGAGGNQDGLKLSGVNDYAVVDCSFESCGGGWSGSGIDQVGCHRGVVARCSFLALAGNGVQVKGGSADVEIVGCTFSEAGLRAVNLGGSTGADYFRPPLRAGTPGFEARSVSVRECTIAGSAAAVAFVGCVDCVVADNTIVNPGSWVVRILQETRSAGGVEFLPASNGRFERNVISYEKRRLKAAVNVGPGTDPGSFRFESNRWHAIDDPGSPPPELPVPESRGAKK
jgi:Right handed beta helix region/Protein of unknown function (DUF1565)